ncbi:MAG: hypothetical protein LBH98_05300 [Chitinispirillales bacterium]|jgi:flagellar biosynthesis protein FlhG|nr:hypothetical protein [Chitinispirillales bacterium]
MKDQAEKLRKIVGNISNAKTADKKICSIMLLSPENENFDISAPLSKAFAMREKKVLIIDDRFGVENLKTTFKFPPKETLKNYLQNECYIDNIIGNICENVDWVSYRNYDSPIEIGNSDLSKFISDLSSVAANYDYIIINGGMEISENTLMLTNSAGAVILTAAPNPASITDAYSALKLLVSQMRAKENIYFLINTNGNENESEVQSVKEKFFALTEKFINFTPNFLGFLSLKDSISFSDKINSTAEKIDENNIGANQNFFANFAQSIGGEL